MFVVCVVCWLNQVLIIYCKQCQAPSKKSTRQVVPDTGSFLDRSLSGRDRLRRETILLKLLVIPCDDLKLIVMRCLSKVPLSRPTAQPRCLRARSKELVCVFFGSTR